MIDVDGTGSPCVMGVDMVATNRSVRRPYITYDSPTLGGFTKLPQLAMMTGNNSNGKVMSYNRGHELLQSYTERGRIFEFLNDLKLFLIF